MSWLSIPPHSSSSQPMNLEQTTIIHVAKRCSAYWHSMQSYGTESYFDGHLKQVVAIVEDLVDHLHPDDQATALAVAYLHDSYEDAGKSTQDVISLFGPIIGPARAEDFAGKISLLTRDRETYGEYISAIIDSKDEIVMLVKKADLMANLAAGAKGLKSLEKRYRIALNRIDEAIASCS